MVRHRQARVAVTARNGNRARIERSSFFREGEGVLRTYGQDGAVRLALLVASVKSNGTVQANEVHVARGSRVPPFVAVDAASSHHVALAPEHVIDLLFHDVVVRDVGPAGSELNHV